MGKIKQTGFLFTVFILLLFLFLFWRHLNQYLSQKKIKREKSYAASETQTTPAGLGQCHWIGGAGWNLTSWAYSGTTVDGWAAIEPEKGEYHFEVFDNYISQAREKRKKVWLQVLTNSPDALVPQWAIEEGVEIVNTHYGSLPVVWNHKYKELFGRLLLAMAEKYDKDEYRDAIGAVIIMAGGFYGEMALAPRCPVGSSGCTPDVLDPNNPLVKSIAEAYSTTPDEVARAYSCTYGGQPYTCYRFDDYFIDSVKKTVDLYAQFFQKLPLVLQLGTGLSYQQRVWDELVRYVNCRYGQRVWTKFNGWEPGSAESAGKSAYSRTGFEGGHPRFFSRSYWRDDVNGDGRRDNENKKCPADFSPDQCEEMGRREIESYVKKTIYEQNNSFLCLQDVFFNNPSEYFFSLTCPNQEVPGFCISELEEKLKAGQSPIMPPSSYCEDVSSSLLTPTVGPSFTPSPTPRLKTSVHLDFIIRFQGVARSPRVNSLPVKVSLVKNGEKIDEKMINFTYIDQTSEDSGKWEGGGSFEVFKEGGYIFYLQGPKHLLKKICHEQPAETSAGSYTCSSGAIAIDREAKSFDFSRIFLLTGDLPEQDGVVNSFDVSLILSNLGKSDDNALRLADVNFDGIVNALDYSLVIYSLKVGR
jgi:hypothetical protein